LCFARGHGDNDRRFRRQAELVTGTVILGLEQDVGLLGIPRRDPPAAPRGELDVRRTREEPKPVGAADLVEETHHRVGVLAGPSLEGSAPVAQPGQVTMLEDEVQG